MTTQWHPLFVKLLRPLVESHYQVETNMPVGDAPRMADLVLLRQTSETPPPFRGLWRWLSAWNVLEFKGPSVSARVGDLDRLIELGLGIHRRLNEEREKNDQPQVERAEMSYWYLAPHLGKRFLADARTLLGDLETVSQGLWRVRHLGRTLVLVSNRDVPVEHDSVPVHLLVKEPLTTTRSVAQVLAEQPELWRLYSGWIATLFPALWEEVQNMGRSKGRSKGQGPVLDLGPVIEHLGLPEVIRQAGVKRVIEEVGPDKVIEEMGIDWLVSHLSPEHLQELKQRLDSK